MSDKTNTKVTEGSKTKRSQRSKKYNSKRTKAEERKDIPMESSRLNDKNRDNDPNWYFTSTELAAQAGELSMQEVLGNGALIDEANIPTCGVVYLNPCPGVSYDFTGFSSTPDWSRTNITGAIANEILPQNVSVNDGANLMAFKMYTLMSSFTGRTSTYGPQDLLIMILAISQVAAISEHIRRAFGMVLTVNARNRALPKGMIGAMGINVDDFIQNLADYRMRFNVQMTRINQIPLLDNIGFIRKCRDMYQKVYVDSDSAMAQNWFFAPWSTWELDEMSSEEGSFLKTIDLPHAYSDSTMGVWLNKLTHMIDAILSSSTMQIVYSDLINLANKVSVPTWQFDYLAENYVVLPEYNRNAQLQLHNLDIIGEPYSGSWSKVTTTTPWIVTPGNDVRQDPDNNRILYNPAFNVCRNSATAQTGALWLKAKPHDTLVDFDVPSPTLEDRIEALRFSCVMSQYRVLMKQADPASFQWGTIAPTLSDHYVVAIHMLDYPQRNVMPIQISDYIISSDGTTNLDRVTMLDKISSAPLLYELGNSHTGADRLTIRNIIGDVNYFTKVPFEYLNRTNRLMYTGLFDFRVG